MSKAIISNRIYLSYPGELVASSITKKLTYKIKKNTGSKKFQVVETIRNYKILPNNVISIPQGRIDLIPEGYEIVDKRITGKYEFPDAKYPLFPEQKEVYDKVNDTCIINALVGWGKSFTALYLAKKFGQKTLILTHTIALRDQWVENILELFGIEAGVIGGGQFDYQDKLITVATTQTLIKKVDQIAKEFGTVIIDECHHIPSTTFSGIVDKLHARYRIALSGTLIRKDGKHVLLSDFFGSQVFKPPQSNTLTPVVKRVNTGITLTGNTWVDKITKLVENVQYQRLIAAIAITQIKLGHFVLVIADRVAFLNSVAELIGDKAALVTGGSTSQERADIKGQILSGEKLCIVGSRQIFSEGISIDRLSCVILAAPMNNDSLLEQIIGRVQRKFEDKLTPVVIDMQFVGLSDKRQNNSRLGVYLKNGWSVETV